MSQEITITYDQLRTIFLCIDSLKDVINDTYAIDEESGERLEHEEPRASAADIFEQVCNLEVQCQEAMVVVEGVIGASEGMKFTDLEAECEKRGLEFKKLKPRIIEVAREIWASNDIEINTNLVVTESEDDGFWVAAWVYVERSDLEQKVDDLCDQCMRSGVEIARTEDGKTICVECDEPEPTTNILEVREQIQEDISCILDGLVDSDKLSLVCQAVVDNFKRLNKDKP